MTEEQDLDGNSQASMEQNHDQQKNPTGFLLGGTDDGEEVLDEEEDTDGITQADDGVVEGAERRPGDEGDGDPEQITISVEGPTLDQVQRLSAEPAQRPPQTQRHKQCVSVDEAGGARQQTEIVLKVFVTLRRQLVADGARQEQYHHHRRRDPERPVQVGVAVHRVEKRGRVGDEWEDGGSASVQHRRCVHVEELGVERERP